ncbi:hypothetical protein SDRG_07210 [Saprolegnia diclina VS20]|uniref:HIG1 domain-containing protein n=1 Tax=Saprolegnia diclina (strain VS20) TaxID=1156394 RepID=T0RYY7_SAPDV|nr:hypothetical protein SDRG_07210 [Saprolegnia diclina VS20]EQC35502.1 hypothetical protein SDRG_07210 [Saprolegnia diclina VS20]|eukprot:XP_008611252.1 hypothetical protein SDRG_07210 [Saprolegnia diclina VS20]
MMMETGTEKFKRKFAENPFVPVGCAVTAVVLAGGLRTFVSGGDSRTQQKFMRARIFAQGATVVALAVGAIMTDNKSPTGKYLNGLKDQLLGKPVAGDETK